MLEKIAQAVRAVVAAEDVHATVVDGAGVEVPRGGHVTCILHLHIQHKLQSEKCVRKMFTYEGKKQY